MTKRVNCPRPARGRKLRFALAAAASVAASLAIASPAMAAGGEGTVIDHDWSFEGPFGTFDRVQLQRGWQVYMEACSLCHGLQHVAFRSLAEDGGPEFPVEQVEAFLENFEVFTETGDTRPAMLTDRIPSPHINDEDAIATHGVVPPDLSVIVKARTGYHGIWKQILQGSGGPEYVYSLLLGYPDIEPEGVDVGAANFNYYFPRGGNLIAMAPPLQDGAVEYMVLDENNQPVLDEDGEPEVFEPTVEQMAADVAAFLMWAAEPHMEARKEAGVRNLIFLAIFAVLLWYSNRKLWKPVKEGRDV